MHSKNKANLKEDELNFRIAFKEEFGVDWNEAWDRLQRQKEETERKWQQSLINNTFRQ